MLQVTAVGVLVLPVSPLVEHLFTVFHQIGITSGLLITKGLSKAKVNNRHCSFSRVGPEVGQAEFAPGKGVLLPIAPVSFVCGDASSRRIYSTAFPGQC